MRCEDVHRLDVWSTLVSRGIGAHRSCLNSCVVLWSREQALFDDLARHFQIHRNADQVGAILVNLVRTDFDFGLAVDALNILRGNQDTLLAKMTQLEVRMRHLVVFLPDIRNQFVVGAKGTYCILKRSARVGE